MRAIIIGLALAIAAPATALAQDISERPSIVVVGRGSAERAPDGFTVTGTLYGRGADQAAALQALARVQGAVMERLPHLDGLLAPVLTTGDVSVEPLNDPECGAARYNSEEACPIIGYAAEIDLMLKSSPVAQAGNAVSYLAELGARDARISAFTLSDASTLRDEANRAAYADARRQADLLAAISGQTIVRVLRLQDAGARIDTLARNDTLTLDTVEALPTGRTYQSYMELIVLPTPVRREASVTVVFEIE